MPELVLTLFGSPKIELNGAIMPFDTRKAPGLLAYLAITQQWQNRETLAALFWPGYAPSRAFANLRSALWSLKKSLGDEWLVVKRDGMGLRIDAPIQIDVIRFRAHLARHRSHQHQPDEACHGCCQALTSAVEVYGGDFLAGFALSESQPFEEWAMLEAAALRRDLLMALEWLGRYHRSQGDPAAALGYALRWVARDPLHEPAHHLAMLLYAETGQRAAALRQYHECVRILAQELGIAPLDETTAIYQAIQDQTLLPALAVGIRPAAQASAAPSQPPRGHNLPAQATRFVGRAAELGRLAELGRDGARLVTLTGLGGVGKTRLALQAAEAARDEDAGRYDGVYFVELAAVEAADLIPTAIAEALDYPLIGSSDPWEQLAGYLADRKALLIIDNAEHLIDGVAPLATLLRQAPGIAMLVTSRRRLNLQEEWVLEVEGLAVPAADTERLEEYSAIALFVQSARRIQGGFALTAASRPAVIEICRMIDGMPLGIELAASWLRVLACEEIAAQMRRNITALETTLRNLPERHRSLRALLDYSWRLLSAAERRALGALAAFSGGFTREAAAGVAEAPLAVLTSLIDASLLARQANGRYSVHELVRQYAAAELALDPPRREAIRARHYAWYMRLVEQANPEFLLAEQECWLAALEHDHDNLRAALRWALDHEDPSLGLRLAASLWRFWHMRGHRPEGLAWVEKALERAEGYPIADLLMARALNAQGNLMFSFFDPEQALALQERSLALARRAGDTHTSAAALNSLGNILAGEGRHAEARPRYLESLALQRELGILSHQAILLNNLSLIAANMGDLGQAQAMLQECVEIGHRLGDKLGLGDAFLNLGVVAQKQRDNAQAVAHYQAGLGLLRAGGDKSGAARALSLLAKIALEGGEYERALALAQESAGLFRASGDAALSAATNTAGDACWGKQALAQAAAHYQETLSIRHASTAALARALEGLGCVACAQDRDAQAATLLGAAERLRERCVPTFLAFHAARNRQIIATLRERLGPDALDRLWAAGRSLPITQAVAAALGVGH